MNDITTKTYIFDKMYYAGNGPIYQGRLLKCDGDPDVSPCLFCDAKPDVTPKEGDKVTVERIVTDRSSDAMRIWINGEMVWERCEDVEVQREKVLRDFIVTVKNKVKLCDMAK